MEGGSAQFSSPNLMLLTITYNNLQDNIPDGGYLFCIILYADKTQLSSFGTAMGYPVYARCANLPTDIRNGKGKAGGRLVGWLPIVCLNYTIYLFEVGC